MDNREDIKNTLFHTAIIGAGAGGLMCAGSFQERKILIDRNEKPGLKISVSGGGRCNFSNRSVSAADYVSQNKHFCKSALAAFKPQNFLQILQDDGVRWEERAHGQLFAFSAQDVVQCLVRRAKKSNTLFLMNTFALDVRRENGIFIIDTSAGPVRAQRVVLAAGGLSFPELGASNFGVKTVQKMGLHVIEQRPALAGLTLPKSLRQRFSALAGNSLKATVSCAKHEEKEQLLFTHEGFSGPAILQASLYWTPGQTVQINFLPQVDADTLFAKQKNTQKTFVSALADYLPAKIAKIILGKLERDLANASRAELEAAANAVNRFTFTPDGTSGYTRAEVTAGGVDTREINPVTFEARNIPGLYIIGELLDVTGRLGGFNLQWAWSSGFLCAEALKKQF